MVCRWVSCLYTRTTGCLPPYQPSSIDKAVNRSLVVLKIKCDVIVLVGIGCFFDDLDKKKGRKVDEKKS